MVKFIIYPDTLEMKEEQKSTRHLNIIVGDEHKRLDKPTTTKMVKKSNQQDIFKDWIHTVLTITIAWDKILTTQDSLKLLQLTRRSTK